MPRSFWSRLTYAKPGNPIGPCGSLPRACFLGSDLKSQEHCLAIGSALKTLWCCGLLLPPLAAITGVQCILILPQIVAFSSNKHHTPYVYLHYFFHMDSLPFYFLLEILLPQDVFQRREAMHSLLSTGCAHAPSSGHYLLCISDIYLHS